MEAEVSLAHLFFMDNNSTNETKAAFFWRFWGRNRWWHSSCLKGIRLYTWTGQVPEHVGEKALAVMPIGEVRPLILLIQTGARQGR